MKIALPSDFRDEIGDLPAGVEVAWYRGLDEALLAVPGAEVIWYHLDTAKLPSVIEAAPAVRWLSGVGAGMDSWPLDYLKGREVIVTNGAGIAAIPISEYVVAQMLAAGRGLKEMFAAAAREEWDAKGPGDRELYGSRVLIVGYGHIGREIGRRLLPFGVEVTGARRRPDGQPGVIGADDWRARLGEFDWVILAGPLTPATRHQLGAAEIAAMKPGAWVLNIARGALIDDTALIPALRDGRLGGAVLDAHATEPLPPESEYWRLANVLVTPHISWKSRRYRERAADLFGANLDRFLRGAPLENIVDIEAGY